MNIDKRPGWDWTVVFRDLEDNTLLECKIFGVMTLAQVVEQAYADAALPEGECEVLAIIRSDVQEAVIREIT